MINRALRKKLVFIQQHGCTLTFDNNETKELTKFEIPKRKAKWITKIMKKSDDHFLIFNETLKFHIVKNKEEGKAFLNIPDIETKNVYYVDGILYAVMNKESFIRLFNTVSIPESQSSSNYSSDQSYVKAKKSPTKNYKQKKINFDWDEAFLEGLRTHGNVDDAEAHADDEKTKFDKLKG